MSKDMLSSTPDTLPLYIAEKLEALGWNPVEDDLDPVRVLFYTPQEERVISDEELQEWKKMEKKILENQNFYKKNTEKIKRTVGYLIPLILLCVQFVLLSVRVSRSMLTAECPLNPFDRWPLDLIVVVIYLFYFYGSELGLKLGTPNPVQPEVVKNEEDDDDDWEGSMTSTELQSRQKALLGSWEPIMKDRVKRLESSGWLIFGRIVIMIYFFFHAFFSIHCLEPRRPLRLPLPTGEYSLFLAEAFFALLILVLLLFQFFIVSETSPSRKKQPQ